MEQQCISIAKGGNVCNLPCRTTVLAAANPIGKKETIHTRRGRITSAKNDEFKNLK